ncbi:hypothetical protein Tco_0954528 [Tanacetum coccineum]|uniref:Uncharacterized protein n=1 Tax=Tanacetum coccineum TaxID=301880 RepID=A0ABQ5E4N2_9ASTR
MAEIGCNWARIGPSKSSQSLSIAHKWAADSSVLTLTLEFLDFGLDFAQSFPFHAQFCTWKAKISDDDSDSDSEDDTDNDSTPSEHFPKKDHLDTSDTVVEETRFDNNWRSFWWRRSLLTRLRSSAHAQNGNK